MFKRHLSQCIREAMDDTPKEELKDRFLRGVVLYTGEQAVSFASDMHAIPVSMLWH
jgi:hypothetical protein